jgi:hypothetical protein
VDWNLLITAGGSTFDLTGPLSGNDSYFQVNGSNLSATSAGLFFKFFDPGTTQVYIATPSGSAALGFESAGSGFLGVGAQSGAINVDAVTPIWYPIPGPANNLIGTSVASTGDLNVGKTVTITFTTSEAVTVTGTLTATLNDGGTATYDAGKSTATSLVFDYTVGSSDTDVAALQVGSINLLNGATIQDGGGNNANLSLSGLSQSGPQIDTTAPATPAAPADSSVVNGYLNAANDTAAQALTGSAEKGSTVTIYDNGTQVGTATANATTGAWSFTIGRLADASAHSYTVTATDAAGNVSAPSGALSFTVDAALPKVLSLTATDPALTNAGTVHYTLTFSEPVTGVDASQFSLVTTGVSGASIASVTPVSGSNGTQYTVTINDGSGDGTLALDFTGVKVRDLAGNPLPGGAFQAGPTIAGVAGHVKAVDLNGDGYPDLVCESSSNTISVMLGNGNGTFQAPVTYAAGTNANGISVGDVNGDGVPDLVISNYNGNGTVSTLLGNGNGTFQQPITSSTNSGWPSGSAIADVNGDGKPDLIVANDANRGGVSILLGNGDGVFTPRTVLPSDGDPVTVAVGDLNGDGIPDLVFSNVAWGAQDVQVYLGNGDGTFSQAGKVMAPNPNTFGVALADLTGNGKEDLIFTGYDGTVSVALGNGNGTFQTPVSYTVGSANLGIAPGNVTVADINGDGKLDLIVPGGPANSVSALFGNGDGTFQPAQQIATGNTADWATVGDFNGDGRPDVAVANFGSDSISVLLNVPPVVAGPTYALDHDSTEQAGLALSFGDTLIGSAGAKTVHFSVGGIDPSDDTAVITFTDHNNKMATATETANGTFTADLSSLADGAIKASMVVTDTAGNSFNANASNSATLDQDSTEQAGLALFVYNVNLSYAGDSLVGTITTDGTLGVLSASNIVDWKLVVTQANNVPNGEPVPSSYDLTGPLSGGNSVVSVNGSDLTATPTDLTFNFQDTSPNEGLGFSTTFGPPYATAFAFDSLYGTEGVFERAGPWGLTEIPVPTNDIIGVRALALSFGDTLIGSAGAKTVHFSIAGMDPSDDTAVITFTDHNNKTATATETETANGTFTADLSSLADGSIKASMAVTDTAGNSFNANASNSAMLDQDSTEQAGLALSFLDTTILTAQSKLVHFSVGGIDPEDSAVVTFTDSLGGKTTATVTANGTATADLSGLADGPITASMQVATDAAGNSFTAVAASNSATLDQDATEQKVLALNVTNSLIGAAAASAAAFTIAGLDSEDTGTATFTDHNGKTVTVPVSGTQTTYSANFTSLADGTIKSSLSVNNDPAGNTFTAVLGNAASLDRVPPRVKISTTGAVTNQPSQMISGTVTTSEAAAGPIVLLYDNGNATPIGTAAVGAGGVWSTTVSLSGDGNHSIVAKDTDAAGNTGTSSPVVFKLDQDLGEQAALKLTVNGGVPISASKAAAVPFTIAGLESDDNGTVSFSDGSNTPVVVNIVNGVPSATKVNLSGLNEGPITVTLHLNNDAVGNSFTNVVTTASLDQDLGEQAGLKLTVNGGNPIGAANAAAVPFTVASLEAEDNGTVTFSDGTTAHNVVVNIVNGMPSATTVNLTGLNDGSIKATLHLNNDAAGNLFTNVVTTTLLDQDLGEQAALKLTVNGGAPISASKAAAVPFTVAGLESDDNGTVSFSDGSNAPVVVNIINGKPSATTVNLTGLNDGSIKGTLHLNNDAAGNSFTNVVTIASLDQDSLPETPSLSAPSSVTFSGSGNLGIVVGAVDSDDKLKVAISGVPSFETITAAGVTPTVTHQGATSTYTFNSLPAADWNNGLVVNSTLTSGHPTNVLTVTVSNTTTGESSTAPAKTISVTDPPAGGLGDSLIVGDGLHAHSLALLAQYMASSFVTSSDGHGTSLITDLLPNQHQLLSLPHAA